MVKLTGSTREIGYLRKRINFLFFFFAIFTSTIMKEESVEHTLIKRTSTKTRTDLVEQATGDEWLVIINSPRT